MTLDHGESFYLGIYIDTEKCSPVGYDELVISTMIASVTGICKLST